MRKKSILFIIASMLLLSSCETTTTVSSPSQSEVNHNEEITLNAYHLELAVNDTFKLVAHYQDQEIAASWHSSDTNIALVTSNGIVSGVSSGNAMIKAIVQGGYALCEVKVKAEATLTGSTMLGVRNPSSSVSLFKGATFQLTPVAFVGEDEVDAELTYLSSNENAFTVSEQGLVMGKGVGSGQIIVTARYYGELAYSKLTVQVFESQLVLIEDFASRQVVKDETLELHYKFVDGATITDVALASLSFSLNNNELALIHNGLLTGLKKGYLEVTASINYAGTTYTCVTPIRVRERYLVNYLANGTHFAEEVVLDGEILKMQNQPTALNKYFRAWSQDGIHVFNDPVESDLTLNALWYVYALNTSGSYSKTLDIFTFTSASEVTVDNEGVVVFYQSTTFDWARIQIFTNKFAPEANKDNPIGLYNITIPAINYRNYLAVSFRFALGYHAGYFAYDDQYANASFGANEVRTVTIKNNAIYLGAQKVVDIEDDDVLNGKKPLTYQINNFSGCGIIYMSDIFTYLVEE